MTWNDICNLDEYALNLAIEEHCYPDNYRAMVGTTPRERYLGLIVRHTNSWDFAMLLVLRYRISMTRDLIDGFGEVGWHITNEGKDYKTIIIFDDPRADVPQQLRNAICRVALWATTYPEVQDATVDGKS